MKTRAQVCRFREGQPLSGTVAATAHDSDRWSFNAVQPSFRRNRCAGREHEHTRRDDGDGRRSASDRRWKRLDERFGLGASKDTVGGRAPAKVPRLDLLMKPLRPAGLPANRDVAGSLREPAAQPGHIGLAKRPDLAPRGGPWVTAAGLSYRHTYPPARGRP